MARIRLNSSARSADDRIAEQNRCLFRRHGLAVINMIGSPGCGKTAILQRTARQFDGRLGAIVGDIKTTLDADRLAECGIAAVPIETGGSCHLVPPMVRQALARLDLAALDLLVIENVGNLVCPAAVDLGEDLKVGVLSVPEGDEKVRKYPALFLRTAAVLVNKVDLLPYCPFDPGRVRQDCLKLNPHMAVLEVSATTGQGFEAWLEFLAGLRRRR